MKYRKKPVVIEAIEWTGENMDAVRTFCLGFRRTTFAPGRVYIETLEGVMAANVGDYIIRGIKGEVYPCKPGIFAATYDPVEEPTP